MLLHMAHEFLTNSDPAAVKTRVNVTTLVNASKIRKETLRGQDYIVVPSATLPDNIVMKGVLYPAEEIAKSYMQLENSLAPLGHPDRDGQFLSAKDPEAINAFHIGAMNRNVRREGGRVLMDKYIHVATANATERGRRVLAAIEAGGPIHTSTGLYAMMEPAANGVTGYKRIARNMIFDHDAILLDEPGAGRPEDGVGMLVNSDGVGEEIPVINSTFTEEADRGIDYAVSNLVHAVHQKHLADKQDGMMSKVRTAILSLIPGLGLDSTTNQEDDTMTVSPEQFKALSDKVDALVNAKPADQTTLAETISAAVTAAIKPVSDRVEAMANSEKAKDEAELTELRTKIVGAGIMAEEPAKELTLNAARALAPKATPGQAAPLLNGFGGGAKSDGFGDYKAPKAEA